MSYEFNFTKIVDRNGRIVIPAPLRERYGLEIGETVEFIPLPKGLIIQPCGKKGEISSKLLKSETAE